MQNAEVKVPFFKKKGRPTTTRKRSASPPAATAASDAPSSSKSEVVLPHRKTATNLLSAGTKRTVSQRQDDEDQDEETEKEKDGFDVKWTSANGHINAALDILAGDEAEEMLAKKQKRADSDDEDTPDDGLYRGQKGYQTHLKKDKEIPKSMRVGPQRASGSTIRTVTIVDYQPDVCKDYKETGYCGFGDTCKFLHDRGTYLAGWQLDKLAEHPAREAGDSGGSDSDSDEELPFACLLCRKPFTDPVATRCGHYFDAACAIKRFARTPKCAACGAPTGGIFNRADKVIEKMAKQRAADAQAGDAQGGAGDPTPGVLIEGLASAEDGDGDEGGA